MKVLIIILSLISYASAKDVCYTNKADNITYCYNAEGSYIKD